MAAQTGIVPNTRATMNRTHKAATLFDAGREAVQRLLGLDADDAAGAACVIAAVASEFGLSVEELENEIHDKTEDDYAPDSARAADDAEHEAMYGRDDADESTHGPAHLHDDGYYARNDAGEYAWM